ncbi:Predicted membrane protein [Lysinibacillus sphaericus]|nr:Predicted membrane protein [Lysinibacillus sphaericus]
MKFCTECGESISKEADFCTNCGKTFQKKETQQQTVPPIEPPSQSIPPRPSKKAMKKSNKIIGIIVGILAIAFISTHFTLKNVYDPLKKIDVMNTAYNNQDKEEFFKQFQLKKGTVADANNFYELVSQYGWTELRNQLTYEAQKIINKEPADMIYDKGEFISITKDPVLLGLYQDVDFTILPTTVSIQLPIANTTFKFGSQEVTTKRDDEQIQLGQYIPGEYEWSYETTSSLMPLSGNGTYTLSPSENNKQELDIDWGFTSLYLDADLEDAIVYINGTSTKKTVSELAELAPAQLNKSVKIQAVGKDKDGNEVKSAEIAADSQDIYLPFDHIQKEQQLSEHLEEVEQIYKSFRSDYADAIYYIDFSYIEDYFKNGSKIRNDYAKFVSDHSSISGYHYEFLLNDVTSITPLSSDTFELLAYEKFNFSSYNDDSLRYDRKKKYVISRVDDEYYIESIIDLETKKTKY